MKKVTVGLDVSPLHSGHKVRGIGFYTQRLLKELRKISGLTVKELRSKEEIRRADYDALHIPYFQPYFFTLPFKRTKPLVVTIHDLIPVKYPGHYPPGVKGWWRWQIQKLLLRRADFIVTDSFASKYDIAELAGYPQDRIYVAYLAAGEEFRLIENQRVKSIVREKYDLPEKFVLYVGDVNWNKNIPGLVKACKKAEVPLVIIGKQAANRNFDRTHPENKDLVWLQKYAGMNPKTVRLLGFVPTTDLATIYNLAAAYCQPSFDEGFGLPLLEAMASGCPVVAANRGSLPEVAGEAAILAEPGAREIARALKKVLADASLRRRLVQAGLRRAKEFSWEKTAQQTTRIYHLLT